MYKIYFKVALRSLIKQKTYTIINIVGLTVSISVCLYIALYVNHELSFDKFNPKADRIYKMVLERKYPNHSTFYSRVPSSFADVALKDFPEIRNTLRFTGPWDEATLTYKVSESDTRTLYNNLLIQADSSFFSFFSVKFLRGDPKTALAHPNQLVITEQFAKKLFRDEDPLNKIINGGNFGEFKITGVCESLPTNSHLKFDIVGSLITDPYYFVKDNNYTSFYTHTYFELNQGADPKVLESKFPQMVDTYASGEIERELKMSWADYKKAGNGYRYFLQPLTSIHLDPLNFELTFTPSGNLKYIYVLIFIALLIITITCINYVNLATARSAERAKEVGVRKVIGSSKIQLVLQFLIESVFLSLVATSLAIILVFLFLPSFNSLINKQLVIELAPELIWTLVGSTLMIGIIAGIYPAFVLSNHKPLIVMKGSFARNINGLWLRNCLVSFQFTVSTVLIACTIIIMQQMHFVQSKEIGFDKSHVVIM
jgi:putative ABC transport system permease protein